MTNNLSVEGKVAIVTGAGRGIGRAIAERFARDKSKIVLVDMDQKGLDETAPKIKSLGGEPHVILANISKREDVEKMVDETVQKFGTVDILVNNAGITRDGLLLRMKDEQFDAVIAVNLKGVYLCTQACAKVMMKKSYGKIVNISSIASRGNFGQTNYSAAKAGVIGMTKTWALELSRYKVNVNAIAPGFIATEMTNAIPADVKEKMISKIPLERAGEPTEVADLVHFLSSDASSYIQGDVISINGGMLL